ncbi:hypothetical protein HMPREF3149_09050 [Corynebacterium sp. HMSC05E07]|nr:hypothetical protein HMPREF3149_09050 [Corynebacterium sp. HMSC05E07]
MNGSRACTSQRNYLLEGYLVRKFHDHGALFQDNCFPPSAIQMRCHVCRAVNSVNLPVLAKRALTEDKAFVAFTTWDAISPADPIPDLEFLTSRIVSKSLSEFADSAGCFVSEASWV